MLQPPESVPNGRSASAGFTYSVGNGISAPRVIYQPQPSYSEEARRAGLQGTVVLWCVIGPDGHVHAVRVQRSLGLGLDEEAMKAVKNWVFEPAKKGDVPVAVQINVEMNFRLTDALNAGSAVGSVVNGNAYVNPALGIEIPLPGRWHLDQRSSSDSPEQQHAGCTGPLCGKPQTSDAMQTDDAPVQVLFIVAYKLNPEYLDRERYPLDRFAETMTQGSIGMSDWAVMGDMTAVELAGRPGYRLLVRGKSDPQKQGFGLVGESNGYIFLIIGVDLTATQTLLPTVEMMRERTVVPVAAGPTKF